MEPTGRFLGLLTRPPAEVPLDEAALLIAAHAEPGLDVAAQLARLDALAGEVRTPTLDGLVRTLFGRDGFGPNRADYYDPRNSLLHEVLDRRVGIPITLAVVALEVGRRIGVPMSGIGMPGHFLLRDKVDPTVFVDPFDRGRFLDAAGCQRLFRSVAGTDAPWRDDFLDPVDKISILARILANLKAAYQRRHDLDGLRWVMTLRTGLPQPHADSEREFSRLMAPLN